MVVQIVIIFTHVSCGRYQYNTSAGIVHYMSVSTLCFPLLDISTSIQRCRTHKTLWIVIWCHLHPWRSFVCKSTDKSGQCSRGSPSVFRIFSILSSNFIIIITTIIIIITTIIIIIIIIIPKLTGMASGVNKPATFRPTSEFFHQFQCNNWGGFELDKA